MPKCGQKFVRMTKNVFVIVVCSVSWYNQANETTFTEARKMKIRQIESCTEKQCIARILLEQLTEWFEVDESREQYISDSAVQPFFAAFSDGEPIGFLCLKETGRDTVELAVMGVKKEYHRSGTGRALFDAARAFATEEGYSFIQVKTVKMGMYEEYDITNRFYLSLGFREFEVLPLWDEANPCQVYVMYIGQ